MAKPTEDPSWAESGTNILEPSAKRADGWLVNDKLPSANMNWIQRTTGRWITWLSAMFGNDGELTQGVAGGSLEASNAGGVRDLSHEGSGSTPFLSATHLRARSSVYIGHPVIGGDQGAYLEEQGSQDFDTSLVTLLAVDPAKTSGFRAQALSVMEPGPTGFQETLQPRVSSLYTRNLDKLVCTINYTWDSAGKPSTQEIDTAGPYNVATIDLNDSSVPVTVDITPLEAFTIAAITTGILDGSITSPQFRAACVRVAGTPNKIAVRLYFYNTSDDAWQDALNDIGHAQLQNVSVSVSIVAK